MSVCRSLNFFLLFVVLFVALFSLWVVPLFMAASPLPRLVFGRGFPVSPAPRAASPAHGLAPRPAPRGGGVFPFFWGSVLFVLFFLFSRPPKAAAGGCRPSGRRPSVDHNFFYDPPARRCRAGGVSCQIKGIPKGHISAIFDISRGVFLAMFDNFRIFAADFKHKTHEK